MITLEVTPEITDVVYDELLSDWHLHTSETAFESYIKNTVVRVLEAFTPGTRVNILYGGEEVLDVPLDELHQYENRAHFGGLKVLVASVYPSGGTVGRALINFTPEINNVIVQ